MKIKIISSLLLLLLTFAGQKTLAQENNYMDLLVMLVDEEYEKCVKKCEKLTEHDDTKKDPLPYLYLSMAYYEMSLDSKYTEDYPKAFFNSLSSLIKYRRVDQEFLFKNDALPYIEKIKFVLAEEIDNYQLEDTEKAHKKIKGYLKKIVRIDPEDTGAELMLGVYEYKTKNKSGGKKIIKSGLENVQYVADSIPFAVLTKSQQHFYKKSLMAYYHFRSVYDPTEALEILSLGASFFKKDEEACLIEVQDYRKLLKEVRN
jgi:hypothetical protein